MIYSAVLDPSSVIWDREDFHLNKTKYYELADNLMEFIEIIVENPLQFLLREELLEEMINGFPAYEFASEFPELYDFRASIYRFLSNMAENIIPFEPMQLNAVLSIPNINQPHFNSKTNEEVLYLLSKLSVEDLKVIFFTFEEIWSSLKDNIVIFSEGTNNRAYEVLYNVDQCIKFFENLKYAFEPSRKHHRLFGWGSKLKLPDVICQELLDSAISEVEEDFSGCQPLFNYYEKDNIFIAFRAHQPYKYHGYPVDENEIPTKVKRKIFKKIS
ncbi:hypothetical protein [Desulfosporosinus sp. SB140]|uniref:hypothetical protein n=1 Tax=Desulfosporosinus paludis TaxID=3115649 RepID=UPI00388E11FF